MIIPSASGTSREMRRRELEQVCAPSLITPSAGAPPIPCNPATPIKFVGHSESVNAISFSPDNKFMLSASSDASLRVWSMQTKEAVAVYRGHNYPIWDAEWGPLGVYFCSGSYDRTARLWSADHVFPLRVFVGHLSDVNVCCFRPPFPSHACHLVCPFPPKQQLHTDRFLGQDCEIVGRSEGQLCACIQGPHFWRLLGRVFP